MPIFTIYPEYEAASDAEDEANLGDNADTFLVSSVEDEDGNDITEQLSDVELDYSYKDDQAGYDDLRQDIADSLGLEVADVSIEFGIFEI
ncbi:hypothetical protein [Phytohalomonas tamaricis]|uniref:hypothetical protein n=1 Tax=Phytohalomonas tamaricis TaxID=2081032 RepID=UPI000D0B7BAF|nr:hypothetical protein [Phytohalomonas tamaricis]